uniref:Integrase catalytic domain-containing protein n=1 Tax=Timema shepardi TaxID=629360 RepID=A0A7R9B412_TIMSH|nr:unnamed protein product [Timema shepardi]
MSESDKFVSGSDSYSDENTRAGSESSTKKRKGVGRIKDATKKLRDSTYETGEDCNCKRFECFKKVSIEERKSLIKIFNDIGRDKGRDSQNCYLAGLISLHSVKRRRPRKNEEARFNDFSYSYKVRVIRENKAIEIPVCFKAFISFFGLTHNRVQTIKRSLGETGKPPVDRRGKHQNRGNKLPPANIDKVRGFFGSLKGRKAHYSLKDSKKMYLPEDSNVKKLLELFLEKNTEVQISYEKFRSIFVTEFNISFGYPRTDTCSQCDEWKAQISNISREKAQTANEEKQCELQSIVEKIEVERKLHLMKADCFFRNKRLAKQQARKTRKIESIAFDYGKNLPVPNITTSDVYFKRQLSFYVFNIHVLATGLSIMYTYDQTVARKGANDVVSMLHHFINTFLDFEVEELNIFCDSASGQNKNFTMFRYLHYMTVTSKRFQKITVTFPIRGHSFMEPDKNMGLIPKKVIAETPDGWRRVIRDARTKPSHFEVIACEQTMFKSWGDFLTPHYKKKLPTATRPIRQMKVSQDKPHFLSHRENYNGPYLSSVITDKNNKKRPTPGTDQREPEQLYHAPIKLPMEKYRDLEDLIKFCEEEGSQDFYRQLLSSVQGTEQQDPGPNVDEPDSDF